MLLSAGVLASAANAAAPPQRPDRAKASSKVAKLPTRLKIEDGVLVIFDIAEYADPANDIEGYLVYWDDYAAEQLFVFGRLAEGPVDVGQALLNLEIDLGIDSVSIAARHWVLRKAVVDALRTQADATEWAPATRGAILDLMGCPVPKGAEDEPAIGCAFWRCLVTAPPDPDGHNGDSNDKGSPGEPGGLDISALVEPKAIFGAARNVEDGGSLTIIASCLIETGSRMDDVIFSEFKGTGNMEILLSREMANRRLWPAIDLNLSGTRKEELLLSAEELKVSHHIRRSLHDHGPTRAMEVLLDGIEKHPTNSAFIAHLSGNPRR